MQLYVVPASGGTAGLQSRVMHAAGGLMVDEGEIL
jgi:hypothetical protein